MTDKELLVLGGSSDFGQELIRKVHKNYSRIFAHYYHHSDKMDVLSEEVGDKLKWYYADLTNASDTVDLLNAVESDGGHPVHIVHIPSVQIKADKFRNIMWEKYQERLDVSLRTLVMTLQRFLPNMVKMKKGKVVVMASSCTNNTPPGYLSDYVTEKYALVGLVRAVATEYANKEIQFNLVSPEMTETKFLERLPELIVEQNAMNSPKKRNLRIEEVIPVLEFLLSPGSDGLTGENIVITGGK